MPIKTSSVISRFYVPSAPVRQPDGRWTGVCLSYLGGLPAADYAYELVKEANGGWAVVVGEQRVDLDEGERGAAAAVVEALPGFKNLE